jgi:hypothetical protein
MSVTQQLTQDELTRVTELRTNGTQILIQLGQIDLEKYLTTQRITQLDDTKEKLYEQYVALQTRETELITELNAKYGIGTVDIETGEFVPTNN